MSVTARGGYQIIDFKNVPINNNGDESTKIDGIFEQAKNGVNKPVLLLNMTIKLSAHDTGVVPPQFSCVNAGNIESGELSIEFSDPAYTGKKYNLMIFREDETNFNMESPAN